MRSVSAAASNSVPAHPPSNSLHIKRQAPLAGISHALRVSGWVRAELAHSTLGEPGADYRTPSPIVSYIGPMDRVPPKKLVNALIGR